MPMLVVNDSDFDLELARLNGSNEKVVDISRGRGNKKEVSDSDRKLIASEAIAGLSVEDIAREYNISKSSISAYKNGSTSTSSYHTKDKELEKNNNSLRADISAKAEAKILDTLGLLTIDKISECKARDIAGIGKDLSSIVRNVQPDIINQQNNQVIIYKPRMREEQDYEIIEVSS